MMSLILASQSPRRADLLTQMGLVFDVMPADVDETPRPGEPARAYVARLACDKARAVAQMRPEAWVLGSDTSVVLGDEILGKPADAADARATLARLSGQTHQVMTAVALARGQDCEVNVVVTDVRFRPIAAEEIHAYVSSGEPMDKAGSYGIQGLGGIFVESLQGSYSAVVGLPLLETAALLANAGCPVWTHWPRHLESQA